MRLAAALLLLASTARAGGPRIGKTSCQGVDWLPPAIDEAVKIAKTCLGGEQGLNPALAERIVEGVDKRFRFRCADVVSGGFSATAFEKGQPPVISLQKKPSANFEPGEYGSAVFHELLHAIDPSGDLIVNWTLHNRGNFPDAVYGCMFACRRKVETGWGRLHSLLYDAWAGGDGVPQGKGSCKNCSSGLDQKIMDQYAGLCKAGAPYLPAGAQDRVPVLDSTYCNWYGAVKKCRDKGCGRLVGYTEKAMRIDVPDPEAMLLLKDELVKLMNVTEAYMDRKPGTDPEKTYAGKLEPREIALLSALDKRGILAECENDPGTYQGK
jgi:hypothetical protein